MRRAMELQETAVPLQSRLNDARESNRTEMGIEAPVLPPTDRGRGAYLALLGCLLVQVPVWGRHSRIA